MSVSLREMLEAGVHYGHQTKFWNPKMKPYIFGARSKIHIINLDKTFVLFNEAIKFTENVIKNKGTILFVGTRTQASEIIAEEAKRAGMPYVDHRWLGGMLTNFETVKNSIKKLEVKTALLANATENGLSKKEQLDLTRAINKLQSSIGGIVEMNKLPSAIFVIDTGCHDIAIQEAKKLGIPVIGVVDSNNDPSDVDYVIPGNDDSAKAIRLYVAAIADTIIAAKSSIVTELVERVKVEMVNANDVAQTKTVHKVQKTNEVALDAKAAIEVPVKEADVAVEAAKEKKAKVVKVVAKEKTAQSATTTKAKKETTPADAELVAAAE